MNKVYLDNYNKNILYKFFKHLYILTIGLILYPFMIYHSNAALEWTRDGGLGPGTAFNNNGYTGIYDTFNSNDDPAVLTYGTIFDTVSMITYQFEVFLLTAGGLNNPDTLKNAFTINDGDKSADLHTNIDSAGDINAV